MPLPLRSTVAEPLLSGVVSRRVWSNALNTFAASVGQNRSVATTGKIRLVADAREADRFPTTRWSVHSCLSHRFAGSAASILIAWP
jgi:hypothetical protein